MATPLGMGWGIAQRGLHTALKCASVKRWGNRGPLGYSYMMWSVGEEGPIVVGAAES